MSAEPRILVIQLKRLGDLILTTPALSALRRTFPKAQITLVIDYECKELAPAITMADEIWQYQRGHSWSLWFKLIWQTFNICLDFTGNDRSTLIVLLSKAARRLGFSYQAKKKFRFWAYTTLVHSPVQENHTIDHYVDLVRPIEAICDPSQLSLQIPTALEYSAENLCHELGIKGQFCVIHPGSARAEKYWIAEGWAAVIQLLYRQLGCPCLITGGSDRSELKHVQEIMDRTPDVPALFNLAGKIDFLLTAALIKRCFLFAGVDTAAAHVAGVFQVAQLVLFGPTNPYHWRARHHRSLVLRSGYNAPMVVFEPKQQARPMTLLSTETVIRAMETLLGKL
ncbi:MAG: glycosyltransferase family 9 protein [Verrucomicrobia bacterium]|nr:glycosyltransferase family 9 protein [Verrucomicrobiota bacterium]